jgi:hypothetical protein
MQAEAELALTLTVLGNAALRGQDIAGAWPAAPGFGFLRLCRFAIPKRRWLFGSGLQVIARDPDAWFDLLRRDRTRLFLDCAAADGDDADNDRNLVAFVGGGPRWRIGAVGAQGVDVWQGGLQLLRGPTLRPAAWGATFVRVEQAAELAIPHGRPLPVIAHDLDAALAAIAAFAREIEADAFVACFEAARQVLDPKSSLNPGRELSAWVDFSPEQARLYDAIHHAWVFGGMGSWNDLWFPDELQERYVSVSRMLFGLIQEAIGAIANG